MLLSLVLMCLQGQTVALPVIPPGDDRGFQTTVQSVVDATVAKDWATAKHFADRLPRTDLKIQIDFSGVPAERRGGFRQAIDQAIDLWKRANPALNVTLSEKGDIKIEFVDKLPADETTKLPKGLVYFVSDDPKDPRIEGVVALHRSREGASVDDVHVRNEAAFLIGLYLGLGRGPESLAVMGRSDTMAGYPRNVTGTERADVRTNLDITSFLHKAIAAKQTVLAGKVHTRVTPTVIDFGQVTQGQPAMGAFEVTNLGDGQSALRVTPDCSCFFIRASSLVRPGENVKVEFGADTTSFPGPFHKSLYVETSDPERPITKIEVKGNVVPAYRFLRNKGRGLVYMEDDGGKATYYLCLAKGLDFKIQDIQVSGVKAYASFEPWQGRLPDPELNGPEEERHGYKIEVLISPDSVHGRATASMVVRTDDKVWHHLVHVFTVQRGIAADPGQLYVGIIKQEPRRFSFLLTRPDRPFAVKSATVDNTHLKVTPERMSGGDWRVVVQFDGKADIGVLSATVKVQTDDPGQPTVEVPVAAEVR